MSTYSRFDPVSGLYDYFESSEQLAAINDDLPVPAMPEATEIGVPSVECGRPMVDGATHVGRGELAKGHVAPPDFVKLSGVGVVEAATSGIVAFLTGAASVAVLWLLFGRRR